MFRGGSRARLEGLGAGWRVSGTDGSSGSGLFWAKLLKADTHNTYALVFSDSLCSDCDFRIWLKCAGSEDSVSQPGL